MNLVKAAKETLKQLEAEQWHYEHVSPKSLKNPVGQDARGPNVSEETDSFEHVKWMLEGIANGYITGDKGNRWLGWAQAIIHVHQEDMPLETFKEINKK